MAPTGKSVKGENSKAKQVRFTELVKESGKPETAVIWEKPKPDSPFMKAVKDNRVLTVFQKPTGTHKDFGRVGFFQQPFTSYLVFPRKLHVPLDSGVIGIKYDLFEQPKSKPPETARSIKVKADKPKPLKPLLKKFEVAVLRTGVMKTTMTLTAETAVDAEAKALKAIKGKRFAPTEITSEIKSIIETGDESGIGGLK